MKIRYLLLLVAMAMSGCSRPPEEKVIILQTGRLRGNVHPLAMKSPLQHYPYLAGYVKAVREEAAKTGATVLLIDLGDSLSGSYASHVTGSQNMVTFFNSLGYDVVALSNLDARISPEVLAQLKARVITPFCDHDGRPLPSGIPSQVAFEKSGLKVEVLANFYGDSVPSEHPLRFPSTFGGQSGGIGAVREYPPSAAELTLLTWMKFESPGKPPPAFLASLQKVGVDAILAHRIYSSSERDAWTSSGFLDWKPPVSLNILRNNGGFSIARMDLEKSAGSWQVVNHALIPMTANSAPADAALPKEIDKFTKEISASDIIVTELDRPWSREDILRAYMASLSAVPGTTAVLYSLESIRADWPQGQLRASGVFNALPWTTPLVSVTMTRAQFDDAIRKNRLSGMIRSDAGDGPLHVTTSEFFAQMLGVGPGHAIPGMGSEFDAFSPTRMSEAEGWEILPAAGP